MAESEKLQKLREQRALLEQHIGLAYADAHALKLSLRMEGKGGMTEAQRKLDMLQRDARLLDAQIRAAIKAGS